jgi:hypothetical protein
MARASALCLVLVAALGVAARADVPCRTGVNVIGAPDAAARLSFLRTNLYRNARYANIWYGTWTGIYGGLSVGQGIALARAPDEDARIDRAFGLGFALRGVAALQALPQKVRLDQPRFERVVRGRVDDCEAVAEGERLLRREIADEKFSNGPLVHAGNFIVNFGLFLGLGAGFHHWDIAGLSAGIGLIVGEAQILSQPRRAKKTYARYRAGLITW